MPDRGSKRLGRFSKRPSVTVSKWLKMAILGGLICVGGLCAARGVPGEMGICEHWEIDLQI
jgi:hypothetical protein